MNEWMNVWERVTVQPLLLETHCSAEFNSNPNQTHLDQLIKVLRIIENYRPVCWGRLELNFAGQRVSKSSFEDLLMLNMFMLITYEL